MFSNFKKFIVRHFCKHISLYFFIILCFSTGIFCGVFAVKALSDIQNNALADYLLSSFKTSIIDGQVNSLQIFINSTLYNAKMLLIIWILAVSIFFFPLIFIIVGARGFALGFTVGFLIENLGYRGMLISTVSILPQNFILIPGIIFLSVYSIEYSISMIKNKRLNKYMRNENNMITARYSIGSFVIGIYLVTGSLIEGYISPLFLKGISQYLIN